MKTQPAAHAGLQGCLSCIETTDSLLQCRQPELKDRLALAHTCSLLKAGTEKQLLLEDLHLRGSARNLLLLFNQVQQCPFIYSFGNQISRLCTCMCPNKEAEGGRAKSKRALRLPRCCSGRTEAVAELILLNSCRPPGAEDPADCWHCFPQG